MAYKNNIRRLTGKDIKNMTPFSSHHGFEDMATLIAELEKFIDKMDIEVPARVPPKLRRTCAELIRIYIQTGVRQFAMTWKEQAQTAHKIEDIKDMQALFENAIFAISENVIGHSNVEDERRTALKDILRAIPVENFDKMCELFWMTMQFHMLNLAKRYDGKNVDLLRMGLYGGLIPSPFMLDLGRGYKPRAADLTPR